MICRFTPLLALTLVAFLPGLPVPALRGQSVPDSNPVAAPAHWVVSWGASPSPALTTAAQMTKAHLLFHDQTLREAVHLSLGGSQIRVRFSNVFGSAPLRIGAARIVLGTGPSRALTFGGRPFMVIPPNAVALSDPADLPVAAGTDALISFYLPDAAQGAGIHYAALQNSRLEDGDTTAEDKPADSSTTVSYWAFLAGVDVAAPHSAGAIAAFGDSITDGAHSTPNTNRRWPDVLAQRLQSQGETSLGVLNAGIGGNRILHDAGAGRIQFGVSALSRYDRDVLAQPGLRAVIILEGINDIGHPGAGAPLTEAVTAEDLIAGLSQLAERAHEHGLKVIAGTLTPFEGAGHGYFTPAKEAIRTQYNEWIRTSSQLDGHIDFDQATRDPNHPARFLPAYDSGDHLHPNDAGYKAMGGAIDLGLFR